MRASQFTRFATRVFLLSIAASMPLAVRAQTTYTWDGGGGDNLWTTGANWVGDSAPVRGSSTFLTFAGSTRTSPFNDAPDWQQIAGMTFASGASGFRIEGSNIGFVNGSGEQVINQNSASTQEINTTFSFSPNQDSQINLNAGDLLISSQNLYIDAATAVRNLRVSGTDSTRRTVTFSGNVNKGGSGSDPDMYIQNNKRALVTGSLTFGSGNDASIFIPSGVLQFSGAGTMTGGRPKIGDGSGSDSAALWLDTAGTTFNRQLELSNGSLRRTIGGLNTSGTVTFSGDFAGGASNYDLAAATGGAAVFSGVRNFNGGLYVNRPEGASTYGGTVILSGTTNSNEFTAILAGTLQFSDFNQLGSAHLEFFADSGDSGTLRYTGGSTTTTKTLWIDNTGITRAAIDVSQAGTTLTWNPGSGAVNQNLTKTGAGGLQFGLGITGSATVGVEAGTLILTGSSSYSGGTVVSGGTLEVSAGGSQGGSAAALGTGTVSIASGAQVKYWLSTGSANTVANPFALSGGTLHTTDGYNTYSGRVTLASGSSTISAQYEDTITLSGGLAGSGDVLFTQSGGTGGWAAPTYVLSGTGANTGTVRVSGSSGGGATKLQVANVNALQSATLDMATGDTGTVEFTVAGTTTYALGGLQGGRNLAFGGNSLSVGGNGQSTTYSGTLSGNGSLTKIGVGTLTLSGTNFIYGSVAINEGVLAVASSGAFQTVPTISFAGGTLQYASSNALIDYSSRFSTAAGQQYRVDTNGYNVAFMSPLTSVGGSLTKLGAGNLQLAGTNSYSGGTTVSGGSLVGTTASIQGNIVNNANVYFFTDTSGTYAGIMSGTGSFTAYGTAGISLTAANTYTGPTTISRGGLQLNGSIAGSLSVASIASLSGTGTIGGNATITGTHSPGNSPGIQTFNADLTYESGAVVNWELIANTTGTAGTNYDQIILPTGDLTFSGSTTLALSFNGAGSAVDWSDPFWDVNRSWIVYDLSGGTTSTIGNLSIGGSLLDSLDQPLSPTERGYFTTSLAGQDVMLNFVAVPEPSTWAMAGLGAAMGWLCRRRLLRRRCLSERI